MRPAIRFESTALQSTFLDPRRGYAPAAAQVEVRFDPLTGRSAHLAHFGAIRPQPLDLEAYGRPEVKGFCPFCPEHREAATPRFPADLVPEGRLLRGQACLVPNLYPYDAHGAVAILTDAHVVPLAGLTAAVLADGLEVGLAFLRAVRARPGAPAHCLMAWNYMPPSGGGLVHPHQQYFATDHPGNRYREELRAALEVRAEHGRNHWEALVEEEARRGERYVGELGGCHWLSPFAPLGVLGDLLGVFPGVCGLESFTAAHAAALVEGLVRSFRAFAAAGLHSFNAALTFGPEGQQAYPAQLRLVPRTFLNPRDGAPDLNFFQAVLGEPVSVVRPEELATQVRPYFAPQRRKP